ncbi:MAG: family 43 glycosylhydrolase [Rikenellaceae bacterium]
MKISTIMTLAAMAVVGSVAAQKPILPDFHADPSAHNWGDGKIWLYPSTDEPGSTSWKEMKRWHAYTSTDLKTWKCEGQIFSLEDVSWATEAAFAPDATMRNGKYYFVFPAHFKIGIAVSDKPQGPFKDAIGKPIIAQNECKGVASFDPCIFIDDDPAKTPYLYYGGGRGCAVVKLKDNMIEREGEIQKLPLPEYAEGIWVHKRKGIYYMTYPNHIKDAEGNIKQKLVYCTAPTPTGPFTFRGEFLDNKSRNSHHSIIEIKGKWYLFYHIQGPSPYERRVCVEYLEYDKEGLIKPVPMTNTGVKPIKM